MHSRAGRFNQALIVTALLLLALLYWNADERLRLLARNTLLLVCGTCAIAVPVGTMLAVLLVKTRLPGQTVIAAVLGVLLLVPLYLQAAAWQAALGGRSWAAGLLPQWMSIRDPWASAIGIHAMASIPWVAWIVGAALWAVEPELEESALLDAPPSRVFRAVSLRSAVGAVLIATLWVAISTAGEMTVTDLYQIRTFAEEVYTDFTLGGFFTANTTYDEPLGFWPGFAATIVLAMLAILLFVRLCPRGELATVGRCWAWKPSARATLVALTFVVAVLFVLVAVPLASLAYKAGQTVTATPQGPLRGWSALKAAELVAGSPAYHADELQWSLLIAILAASSALVSGGLLAWRAVQGGRVAAAALIAVLALAWAVPGPVLGIGLIRVLNQPGSGVLTFFYDRTIVGPWLAQWIKVMPLVTLMVWYALASVSRSTLESAESEGAGWLTRLVRVALPARWPAIASAWLIGVLLALGELPATLLVAPPGVTTLPVRIFGLLHFGVEDRVAAIALAMVLAVALGFLLVGFLLYRARDQRDGMVQ